MTRERDPITFAVIKSALDTIVDDMAYSLMRTARSSIVRDVLDYSATICDRHGKILSQAKTVALHLGAVPDGVAAMLERFEGNLAPGDVIILNDPYEGGMHLPDIFMFKPIFIEDRLQGYAVVIAHHSDMGGRVAGSNASDSTEIYQEGLRFPPVKLFDRGVRNETLITIFEKNVRLPGMVIGDLEAQLATCNVGEREFIKLIKRYGEEDISDYFDGLMDYAESLTRDAIKAWPDGTYSFTDYIDGDGFSDTAFPICCALTVDGGHITVDFAGSSPQVKGAINSTFSFTKSSTYLTIRCALGRNVPNNAGVYRCISVTAPEGSILNPRSPAPVAARALTGYRVVDTVMGALAKVVPDKVTAAGEGGNTVVSIGGFDRETGTPFVLVDMINGAWGARADKDGIEGVTNPSQNMSNLPTETLEARFPVQVEAYAFREDSCGAGKYRGGLGLVRKYKLLAKEAVLQVRSDRHEHLPYGLFGGLPAAPCRNVLNPDGQSSELPSKATLDVTAGSVMLHLQSGGGGYGDPMDRDYVLIERDLADEKVSPAYVAEHHGVVFGPSGSEIDVAASDRRRENLRESRSKEAVE
ncbi:MAG: hydantoinase B/oxoprolinase family protein [Rhodospirillaceae bacterium]|nr:hydantoinase B/oxoprolinase family protein [Rhodospirillaceae bacterium]